jgi:hypothetical protein
MNLSKQRLLQIIREEIASIAEANPGAGPPEDAGDDDKEESEYTTQSEKKGGLPGLKVPRKMPKAPEPRVTYGEKKESLARARIRQMVMEEMKGFRLDEAEKWIQGAEKDIERRGTEGVCTGKKFGGPTCRPGTKRYNLAKTFRKMGKKRKKKK